MRRIGDDTRTMLKMLLAGALLLGGALAAVAENDHFDWQLIKRPSEKTWLVTNMPKEEVMRPVFEEALMQENKCEYVPVSSLGSFGKGGKDLLAYNPTVKNETIVLLDWSAMTDDDRAKLETLASALFRAMDPPAPRPDVNVWIQRTGRNELQAWIDLPRADLFQQVIAELKPLDLTKIANHPSSMSVVKRINELALITNDATVSRMFRELPYTRLKEFNAAQVDGFRSQSGMTTKVIALNWNEDLEIAPSLAASMLPPTLAVVTLEQTPDRMGIAPWQRFCREAEAKCYDVDGVPTWLLRAPTARHLHALARVLCARNLEGETVKLPVCDLCDIDSLAVSAYLMSEDLDKEREKLVIQEQLGVRTKAALGEQIPRLVSGADWGPLLREALGAGVGEMFGEGGGAEKIVAASGADAVLLLWVKRLTPSISYDCLTHRLTEPLPPFTQPEPRKPDPDGKYFLGGHMYPGDNTEARRRSDKYQKALREWQIEHDAWEEAKRIYEEQVRNREVQYNHELVSQASAKLDGFVKVIDLTTKTTLWTCDVSKTISAKATSVRKAPETVRGENTHPKGIEPPPNETVWGEATYAPAQDALLAGLEDGLKQLATVALWPSDLEEWNRPASKRADVPAEP